MTRLAIPFLAAAVLALGCGAPPGGSAVGGATGGGNAGAPQADNGGNPIIGHWIVDTDAFPNYATLPQGAKDLLAKMGATFNADGSWIVHNGITADSKFMGWMYKDGQLIIEKNMMFLNPAMKPNMRIFVALAGTPVTLKHE